jgi:hypothetical protein
LKEGKYFTQHVTGQRHSFPFEMKNKKETNEWKEKRERQQPKKKIR